MNRYGQYYGYDGVSLKEDGEFVLYEDAVDLQRQLAEVTRERDTLKAMVDLHDAMNDRRRAQANEIPFKRRTYENG